MTSVIKFHALSGSMGETPPCYILEFDDTKSTKSFRFLLDCGLDENFDADFIAELKKHAHKIDCVLLSHSDTYHLGSLPYLVGKCGLKCPIYATIPIFKMGQMFMYDWYLNRSNVEEFSLFNLDDIDSAFDHILQLEYGHPINLKGGGLGISVTALPAGHSLGGTAWKISMTGEQDIYYAIDHNNKKERHLNGFEVDKIARPGIFITNALNALYVQEKRRKRDEMLLGKMQQTLRAGGNVLIAADTAGRSLELILMLDQMFRMKDSGLAPYSLVFLNNVAFNVVEFAKSQIEWMSEKLIRAFENQKTNPFQLKNVIICHTLIELSQIASPKVVITSTADLECGFSRDLFLQWCQDPLSSVILTHRTSPGTLGRILIDGVPRGNKMELEVKQRVKLEGKELEDFLQKKKQKQMTDKKKRIEEIEIAGDDDDNDDPQVIFASVHNQKRHELNLLQQRSEDGDTSTAFKMNNNNHPSFPDEIPHKRRRFDSYGEIIRVEDFKENGKLTKEKPGRKLTLSSSESTDAEPPTKTVSTIQTFSVNCQIQFIDFEGRSDIEAVLKLLQEIQPQQLVIVRGPPQSTTALETLIRRLLPNTKISKPSLRKVVNLTSGSSKVVHVKLTDSLMSSLPLKKVKDCEIAWVDGELDEANSSHNMQSRLMLRPLPKNEIPKQRGPCVVNRLRISELRQLLAKKGINCELTSGILTCTCANGIVYIQKDPATKSIHIECDGLPEEYYEIRSLLYEQMAIL